MLLIPDNATLRQFIPNTFATQSPTSATLFEKIEPMLTEAELWLTDTLIPETLLLEIIEAAKEQADPMYFLPRRLVAAMAWKNAIPSIDVIITPNGVGVAENNTIKPASKAKIDRLIQSVSEAVDFALQRLICLLPTVPGWLDTQQAEQFRQTLFPNINYLPTIGIFSDCWKWHEAVLPVIKAVEDRIAEEFISPELMAALRQETMTDKGNKNRKRLIETIKMMILRLIRPSMPKLPTQPISLDLTHSAWAQTPEIETIMSMIIRHCCDFPEFRGTTQEHRLHIKPYRNRQTNGGYFF